MTVLIWFFGLVAGLFLIVTISCAASKDNDFLAAPAGALMLLFGVVWVVLMLVS
jgi:hypothetical protein